MEFIPYLGNILFDLTVLPVSRKFYAETNCIPFRIDVTYVAIHLTTSVNRGERHLRTGSPYKRHHYPAIVLTALSFTAAQS